MPVERAHPESCNAGFDAPRGRHVPTPELLAKYPPRRAAEEGGDAEGDAEVLPRAAGVIDDDEEDAMTVDDLV